MESKQLQFCLVVTKCDYFWKSSYLLPSSINNVFSLLTIPIKQNRQIEYVNQGKGQTNGEGGN